MKYRETLQFLFLNVGMLVISQILMKMSNKCVIVCNKWRAIYYIPLLIIIPFGYSKQNHPGKTLVRGMMRITGLKFVWH